VNGAPLDPLWLSLRVSAAATLLAFVVGVPLAWVLARRRFPGRDLLAVAVILPMVLPPTVLGYYLLVVLGRQSAIGAWTEAVGLGRIVFTPAAAIIAAFVAALPFLVRTAQGGFEQVDRVYEDAARTLGLPEWRIALLITIPLAWRGIVAGLALAFARAMGEFGATLMLAGNIPGRTQTASIAIYDAVQGGRFHDAGFLALVLSGVTALVLLLMTGLGQRTIR
jgi:molybdate transport system permease protein